MSGAWPALDDNRLRSRNGYTLKIERIRAEILTVLPLNAAQERSNRIEEALIPQLSKNADVEIGLHIKRPDFTVRKGENERVINIGDRKYYFLFLIAHMDVWQVMLACIEIIHLDAVRMKRVALHTQTLRNLCRYSDVFGERTRLRHWEFIFQQPSHVHINCFVHVARNLITGPAGCHATRQIRRIRRVVAIRFFDHNQKSMHLIHSVLSGVW